MPAIEGEYWPGHAYRQDDVLRNAFVGMRTWGSSGAAPEILKSPPSSTRPKSVNGKSRLVELAEVMS